MMGDGRMMEGKGSMMATMGAGMLVLVGIGFAVAKRR